MMNDEPLTHNPFKTVFQSEDPKPAKPMSRGKHWFSASRRRPPIVVHAPDTLRDKYPYCLEFGASPKHVAKKGDTVTCKCCLKKLKKNAQYANYLLAKGIECRGAIWTDEHGNQYSKIAG